MINKKQRLVKMAVEIGNKTQGVHVIGKDKAETKSNLLNFFKKPILHSAIKS